MVSTSLKTDRDLFRYPPRLIPNPITYERYPAVFRDLPLVQGLLNSAKIAVLSTAGTVLSSALAGYAFAKIRFKLKQGIFAVFLATLMIPWQVTLIPLYITFSRIGWIDTHLPLIVPRVLINAYGVFLMKQFIQRIPNDYIESAQIDGANHLRIFWSIILPLIEPPLITLGLFSFIGSWNSFLSPLIYLNTAAKFTVQLVINTLRTMYYTEWGLLMAAATIAILPILALYMVAQRYFIQGITLSGLKG
jgi:multiple sugar transport system permease protein